ncbi:uncharacterized membrane protein YuzA (DUF378 family) [Rhizobium aquaticum]|uniref:Uncharacterized membrane protein YuzA (DUF378 family) n=1 Tax=Rhizobium aquaticum TaxID=1549636 RepID=A0ABV2IXE3_9HYPH
MKRTRLAIGSLFGIVSVTTLIAIELLAAVGAFAWALSGLFNLNDVASYILGAIVGIPSLWLVAKVARLAMESEREMLRVEERR